MGGDFKLKSGRGDGGHHIAPGGAVRALTCTSGRDPELMYMRTTCFCFAIIPTFGRGGNHGREEGALETTIPSRILACIQVICCLFH